jgi:hypothetical protein
MTNTNREDLMASRYGKKPARNSRLKISVAAAALFAIFLAWAAWVTIFAPPTVKASVAGYEVVDSSHTTIRFDVVKPAGKDAVCAARVLDKAYSVVGYREILINADAADNNVFNVSVNTTQEGVTGLVDNCWLK